MARRNQRRDKRGRFASSASRSTRVKRAVPMRVVKGTHKVRVGRVGPGGEYAGFSGRCRVEAAPRRARFYVGASVDRKIAY